MRREIRMLGIGGGVMLAVAAVGAVVEMRDHAAREQVAMGVTDPRTVVFEPAPIKPEWILEGHPTTEAAEIAHTDDGSTKVYVWKTSAAKFRWMYDSDEVVTVVDGDVFIDDGVHGFRHLGPGDVAFFPAGARTTWRVPDHLRKIATLKRPVPGPVAAVQRWVRFAKSWLKPGEAFAAQ